MQGALDTWPPNAFKAFKQTHKTNQILSLMEEWMFGQLALFFIVCCVDSFHSKEATPMKQNKS